MPCGVVDHLLAHPDSQVKEPAGHAIAFSRHAMPELGCGIPSSKQERAQGMPGAGLAHGPPATKNAGGSHHRFSRTSGIPRAMGLRLIRALPGDRLSCPRVATTRKRVALGISTGDARTTRFQRPRPISRRAKAPDEPRPPHPRLAYRDDRAYAPLAETGWRGGNH
jgi:hypothetical protein